MKLLLIDQNPIIQKLVSLSAQKSSVDIETISSMSGPFGASEYDFVFIDDDVFDEGVFIGLKESVTFKSCVLIIGKNRTKPDGFDTYIQKPFLPTELVDFFTNAKQANTKTHSTKPIMEEMSSAPASSEIEDSLGLDEFEIGDTSAPIDSSLDSDLLGDIGGLDDLDIGITEPAIGDDLGDLGDLGSDLDIGSVDISPSGDTTGELDELLKDGSPSDLDPMDFGDLGTLEPEAAPVEPALDDSLPDMEDELGLELGDSLEAVDAMDMGEGALEDITGDMTDDLSLDVPLDEMSAADSANDMGLDLNEDISMDLGDGLGVDSALELGEELGDAALTDDLSLDDEILEPMLEQEPGQLDESLDGIEEMDLELDSSFDDDGVGSELGGGILPKDDIDEVKNLLDDDASLLESDSLGSINDFEGLESEDLAASMDENLEDGDSKMQDIKIENSELASLTEEALSEALGEESLGDSVSGDEMADLEAMDALDESIGIGSVDELPDLDDELDMPVNKAAAPSSEASRGVGSDDTVNKLVAAMGTMNTDTLRGLLDGLQVTLNLSYPKK